MFTWGYIKEAALAKLDLTPQEAETQSLISRFYIYANEVITTVCSLYKPSHKYAKFEVLDYPTMWRKVCEEYGDTLNKQIQWDENNQVGPYYPDKLFYDKNRPVYEKPEFDQNWEDWYKGTYHMFWDEIESHVYKNLPTYDMPDDFISFGDDVNYEMQYGNKVEIYDTDVEYVGDNGLIFSHCGIFYISYNARWFVFTSHTPDSEKLRIPDDILMLIPTYIAQQCYKIDDEYKSAVYRNEYETALARLDDTNMKNTKTFKIGGGW